MNLEDALAQLNEYQDAAKAESSAAYHKAPRPYLGVANPIINDLTKEWRTQIGRIPEGRTPTFFSGRFCGV